MSASIDRQLRHACGSQVWNIMCHRNLASFLVNMYAAIFNATRIFDGIICEHRSK